MAYVQPTTYARAVHGFVHKCNVHIIWSKWFLDHKISKFAKNGLLKTCLLGMVSNQRFAKYWFATNRWFKIVS
jgi:hypothetical protein